MTLAHTIYRESISDLLDSPAEGSMIRRLLLAFDTDAMVPVYGFAAKSLHFRLGDPLTPFQFFEEHDPNEYAAGLGIEGLKRAAAMTLRLYTHERRSEQDVKDRYDMILATEGLPEPLGADIQDLRENVRSVGNIVREVDKVLDPNLDRIVLVAAGVHPRKSSAARFARYAKQRRDQIIGS